MKTFKEFSEDEEVLGQAIVESNASKRHKVKIELRQVSGNASDWEDYEDDSPTFEKFKAKR